MASPVVVYGTVYIGAADKQLYALDAATGQQRWGFATQDWIVSAVAVADGRVVVASHRPDVPRRGASRPAPGRSTISSRQKCSQLRSLVGFAPQMANAHYFLAVAYAQNGQAEAMLAPLQQAVCLDPRHARAHSTLAALYLERQQYDLAW